MSGSKFEIDLNRDGRRFTFVAAIALIFLLAFGAFIATR